MSKSIPATIQQHPESSQPEQLHALLTQGDVAHVAYAEAGQPYSIPCAYHFDPRWPEWLYLYGERASDSLKTLAQGVPLCINVTLLDELPSSRAARHHFMNYRSAIIWGRGQIEGELERKRLILEGAIARRHGEGFVARPEVHLENALVIAVQMEDFSVDLRAGGASAPQDADDLAAGTAGVLPRQTQVDSSVLYWRDAQGKLCISTDPTRFKAEEVLTLLEGQYWSAGLDLAAVQRRLANSVCYGVFEAQSLIGFVRLCHDGDRFAYLADMIIAPTWRGQGVGRWLLECVLEHPVIRRGKCLLATRDAHSFYRKMGFESLLEPDNMLILPPK